MTGNYWQNKTLGDRTWKKFQRQIVAKNKNARKTHEKRTRAFNQINQTLVNKTLGGKMRTTQIGFLRRGDYFFYKGTKYKISHLLENSYVSCINVATGKKERFYIDLDIEVEQ